MIDRRRRTVVVGAGVAGCALASRISRTDEVVLIEAGPRVGGAAVPVDVHAALTTPGLTWPGVLVRRVAGGPMVEYPMARGVGGGSLVNGLVVDRAVEPLVAEEVAFSEFGPVDRALVAGLGARPLRLSRRSGARFAASEADLGRVDLRAGALVRGVVTEESRVAGVEIDSDGAGIVVEADRVVLAAGAFGSPRLLQAARLGGPTVGFGLQDHPSVVVPLAGTGAFDGLVSGAVARFEGLEVLALNRLPNGQSGIAVALLDPASRGHFTADEIDLNLLDDDTDDLARLTAGVTLVLDRLGDALRAEGLAVGDRVPPGGDPAAMSEWVRYEVANSAPAYTHAAASCSVGVVDARHRVGGVDGLFVVDASTLPAVPAGSSMTAIIDQVNLVARGWSSR